MKKLLAGLLVVVGMMTFVGCSKKEVKETKAVATTEESETSLADIKEQGYFTLGLDDSFPPMGFRDKKTNKVVGFDIDLATEVAKRLGVELKIQPIEWDAKTMELKNKNIDVIWNGLTITEDRKGKFGFSSPYLKNSQIIIVAKDSAIDKQSDLAGKVVGVQLDSSGEAALNATDVATSAKEVVKFNTYTEALLDITAGRVDAVVVDEVVGRYYISKKPGEYKVASEDFGSEEYGVGFRIEDASFIKAVDEALDAMKKDGTADEIANKWFGDTSALKK